MEGTCYQEKGNFIWIGKGNKNHMTGTCYKRMGYFNLTGKGNKHQPTKGRIYLKKLLNGKGGHRTCPDM
eukprot:1718506-Prorocentrum_lima.AAC.1